MSVNYTIGTEVDPDVSGVSANCQNSMIMHENYLLDKVLQDEFEELAQVRADITRISETVEFFKYAQANTRFFQVCASYPTTRAPRNRKLTIFLVPLCTAAPDAASAAAASAGAELRTSRAADGRDLPGPRPAAQHRDRRAPRARGRAAQRDRRLQRVRRHAHAHLRPSHERGAQPVAGQERSAVPRQRDAERAVRRLLRLLG